MAIRLSLLEHCAEYLCCECAEAKLVFVKEGKRVRYLLALGASGVFKNRTRLFMQAYKRPLSTHTLLCLFNIFSAMSFWHFNLVIVVLLKTCSGVHGLFSSCVGLCAIWPFSWAIRPRTLGKGGKGVLSRHRFSYDDDTQGLLLP